MKDKVLFLGNEGKDLMQVKPGEWRKAVVLFTIDRACSIEEPHGMLPWVILADISY
ncbi:MAG: hypothetical protein NTV68_08810 [Methanomicrobiales archaeon]|nr:hypothetical protein [Methanomicrobiales archaeon]